MSSPTTLAGSTVLAAPSSSQNKIGSPEGSGQRARPESRKVRSKSADSGSSSAEDRRRMLRRSRCSVVRPASRCSGVASHAAFARTRGVAVSAAFGGSMAVTVVNALAATFAGAATAISSRPTHRASQARHPSPSTSRAPNRAIASSAGDALVESASGGRVSRARVHEPLASREVGR